jgi:uncharacterized membrane protein YobD (UPF0266 family)
MVDLVRQFRNFRYPVQHIRSLYISEDRDLNAITREMVEQRLWLRWRNEMDLERLYQANNGHRYPEASIDAP